MGVASVIMSYILCCLTSHNNNNKHDNVYGAVIMAEPLRELHSRDNTAVDRTTVCSLCVIQKDGVSVRLQVRSYAIL